MEALLSTAQSQAADQYTIKSLGIPELVLMEHAALGIVAALEKRFGCLLPETRGVIVAGPGNNGGDALAVARLLHLKQVNQVSVVVLGEESKLSASCRAQLQILKSMGLAFRNDLSPREIRSAEWVVDGIFGTGLTRNLEGIYQNAVQAINDLKHAWIVSIDLPSGLCSDTGQTKGAAVKASQTVALGYFKLGQVTGDAGQYVGELSLCPLQIPRVIPGMRANAYWYGLGEAKAQKPNRLPTGNKGSYGHVYVAAGVSDTEGASVLVATAALRTGAGLTTVLGDATTLSTIKTRLPVEIMTAAVREDFFATAKGVAAIGPGLGKTAKHWEFLKTALKSNWPLVLDADAITLLSENAKEAVPLLKSRTAFTVITPHPKEASRLLGSSTEEIQKDRYAAIRSLVDKWNVATVLKGKGTLTLAASGKAIQVVTAGNSILSKGGTGDVLCGIVAALLAQGKNPEEAMPLACYLHGRAGEILSQRMGTERAALAGEIANCLPSVWKELES